LSDHVSNATAFAWGTVVGVRDIELAFPVVHGRLVDAVFEHVRSGPGVARTILLFHIISARPSKQPLRVRTFLKVYMELGS
jgi:hypothetical protein